MNKNPPDAALSLKGSVHSTRNDQCLNWSAGAEGGGGGELN